MSQKSINTIGIEFDALGIRAAAMIDTESRVSAMKEWVRCIDKRMQG